MISLTLHSLTSKRNGKVATAQIWQLIDQRFEIPCRDAKGAWHQYCISAMRCNPLRPFVTLETIPSQLELAFTQAEVVRHHAPDGFLEHWGRSGLCVRFNPCIMAMPKLDTNCGTLSVCCMCSCVSAASLVSDDDFRDGSRVETGCE